MILNNNSLQRHYVSAIALVLYSDTSNLLSGSRFLHYLNHQNSKPRDVTKAYPHFVPRFVINVMVRITH